MRKKRKYTRKKKHWKLILFKKIGIYGFLVISVHILFINTQIIFSSPVKSDIIVVLGNEKQNSQKISANYQIIINKSIDLFQENYAEKILILSPENNFGIDGNKLLTQYLMKNEIWGGSIANENSSLDQIGKNSSVFLQKNDWNSLINVSSFGNTGKMKYQFGTKMNQKNISIQPVYLGVFDTITGIFTNYYYFWKT